MLYHWSSGFYILGQTFGNIFKQDRLLGLYLTTTDLTDKHTKKPIQLATASLCNTAPQSVKSKISHTAKEFSTAICCILPTATTFRPGIIQKHNITVTLLLQLTAYCNRLFINTEKKDECCSILNYTKTRVLNILRTMQNQEPLCKENKADLSLVTTQQIQLNR